MKIEILSYFFNGAQMNRQIADFLKRFFLMQTSLCEKVLLNNPFCSHLYLNESEA